MADIYYKNCMFFHPSNAPYGSGMKDTSRCVKVNICSECKRGYGRSYPKVSDIGCPVDCKDFEYTEQNKTLGGYRR